METMTERATKRPEGFTKPAYWTNDPVPAPAPQDRQAEDAEELSPTRYGDWVHKGIAVDF
ncbi:DUF1674 domain-containing protein [Novosphingobium colocasiae]|uniref:DUF1674 domain-containing protein n=1 Tax=Novosphingobium colocasiae TaxID=1256513 RepID=UPI0035B14596